MTTPAAATPKPWFTRWWVWLLAVVAVLVVVSAIGNAIAPRGAPAAESTPTPTITASPPVPAAAPTTATAAESASPGADNAVVFAALKDQFGGVTPAEVFASDPSLWYGWISGTRVEGTNFYVTLQVGPSDAERRDLGERAATAIPTLLPAEARNGLSWVIVEDATGVVIDQKML
jgi:hypothetical protein